MPPKPATLKEVLRQRTQALAEHATTTHGKLDTHELQEIAHLARLVEVQVQLQERPRRKRWPLAVLFILTLALVSGLLFARVPATVIMLEARVSAVSFRLREEQALFHRLRLASLEAQNVQTGALPLLAEDEGAVELVDDAGLDDVLTLAVSSRPATAMNGVDAQQPAGEVSAASEPVQGSLDVHRLILPSGSRVDLDHTRGPARPYRMALTAPDLELDLTALGTLTLSTLNSRTEATLEAPEPFNLRPLTEGPNAGTLFLELAPLAPLEPALASPLAIADLSFFRTVDISDLDQGIVLVPELSTVLSATIHLESLGGREVKLEEGQWLEFDQISGELLSLAFAPDHITLRLNATVRGMTTGFKVSPGAVLEPPWRWLEQMLAAQQRDLMPTWLAWLHAQQGVLLLWSATLYLFGLTLTLRRWWAA